MRKIAIIILIAIVCAAYYGTGNTIGVWHTWYEGGVDNSWEKVAQ